MATRDTPKPARAPKSRPARAAAGMPEGEYGGGTVMIWDKGIWAPAATDRLGDESDTDRQLRQGELKFVLLGEKLAGSWVLVRTRGTRQWLLIKHRDEYASDADLTI